MSDIFLNAQTDTLENVLNEIEVVSTVNQNKIGVNRYGVVKVNRDALIKGARLGGEVDIINSLSTLPGFSTVSDMSSGVSINGTNYSQSSYNYAGAPVFFPFHFGGIFSTFNALNIGSAEVYKNERPPQQPDRIGGAIDIMPRIEDCENAQFSANIGMLASSLRVGLPMGISFSGRISYIDLLYGNLIRRSNREITYGLKDFNIAYKLKLSSRDIITSNFICSYDKLKYGDKKFGYDTRLRWGNYTGSVVWKRENNMNMGLYLSSFSNTLTIDLSQFGANVPSSILQVGTYCSFLLSNDFSFGYRLESTHTSPMHLIVYGALDREGSEKHTFNSLYGKIHSSWKHRLNNTLSLNSSLGLAYCKNVIPSGYVKMIVETDQHAFSFGVDVSSQYLHQVGMSDIGMSSNFYMPSTIDIKPQMAYGAFANLNSYYLKSLINISLNAYYKRIFNDSEYTGTMIDILKNYDFNPLDYISSYNGHNLGIGVMAKFNTKPVNGWICYDWAISRRRYDDKKYHPSPYEPLHSFKCECDWIVNPKISLSAFFTINTGRVYTPIKSVYIFAQNVIMEYGDHNSKRLPNYHRLDMSMTYQLPNINFHKYKGKHFLNFSFMNIYGHNNVDMQYFKYDKDNNTVRIKQNKSLFQFLPSVSYTLEF